MQNLLAALKALLPVLEPALAKEVDQLLQQAEDAFNAKSGSPDIKLGVDCLIEAVKKFGDFELAKIAAQP